MEILSDTNLTIRLVGDVMLGRSVNNALAEHGPWWVWGDVLRFLRFEDRGAVRRLPSSLIGGNRDTMLKPKKENALLVGNLETSITNDLSRPWPGKEFHFAMDPEYASTLSAAGFDFLSLGNNHILDFGVEGMRDTLFMLKELDIQTTGAGEDSYAASLVVERIVRPSGIRVAFLSAGDHPEEWASKPEQPGIFYIDVTFREWDRLLDACREAATRCPVVVVCLHVGPNWTPERKAPQSHRELAHDLIDVGATVVLYTSSHHVLPMERYGNGIVFYGLGDFVDDYAVDETYRNDLGCVAEVNVAVPRSVSEERRGRNSPQVEKPFKHEPDLRGRVESIRVLPTRITDMQVNAARDHKDIAFVLNALDVEKNTSAE